MTKQIPKPLSVTSFLIVATLMLATLLFKLLPGILAASVGFLWAHAMSSRIQKPWGKKLSAATVILTPMLLLALVLLNAKGMAFGAIHQYQSLMEHLATTVLEIRQKLPVGIAEHIPREAEGIQAWLAEHLKGQASAMTHLGTEWLHSGLFAFVGLVIGSLINATPISNPGKTGLSEALRRRATAYIGAFRQIVLAQFWIAVFNSVCTALFLFAVLPLASVSVPYSAALVGFTFFASLIPVVGNLVCNGVLAIAGVSVSPLVGLSCLAFLIVIHKAEYFINAKVVGKQTNTSAWELLTVMFLCEAIFGVAGLVAAPLFYAYIKRELTIAQML